MPQNIPTSTLPNLSQLTLKIDAIPPVGSSKILHLCYSKTYNYGKDGICNRH
jgi:hypothetical protein